MSDGTYPALGFDPAPGNPHEVAALVSTLGDAGAEFAGVRDELHSVGNMDGAWIGKAAAAFVGALGELPSYLERAEQSTHAAYRALTSWQYDLEDFERRGRTYEQRAEEARQQVAAARATLDAVPQATGRITDRAVDELTQQLKAAQRAYSAAEEELNQILRAARQMLDEHQQLAREVARRVRDAADDAPPEPGLFEALIEGLGDLGEVFTAINTKITDWFQEHAELFKRIGDVLADAAMVVGIAVAVVAMFATPAGWLVAAAVGLSAGALLFHGVAKAGGAEVSTKTMVMDSLGLLAGLGGLAAGARIGTAAKGLTTAGASTVRSGRSLIASGRGVSTTLRGAGQITRGRAVQFSGYAMKYNSDIVDAAGYADYTGQHVRDGVSYQDIPVVGSTSKLFDHVTDDRPETARGPGSAGSAGRAFANNVTPRGWAHRLASAR